MKIPGAGSLRIILTFSGPDSVSSIGPDIFADQVADHSFEDCAYFKAKPAETVYGMG